MVEMFNAIVIVVLHTMQNNGQRLFDAHESIVNTKNKDARPAELQGNAADTNDAQDEARNPAHRDAFVYNEFNLELIVVLDDATKHQLASK